MNDEDKSVMEQIEHRGYGMVRRILHTATILYQGWEMDNRGWVCEMADGSVQAFTTNHGGIYLWEREDMAERLQEMKAAAESVETALSLLKR